MRLSITASFAITLGTAATLLLPCHALAVASPWRAPVPSHWLAGPPTTPQQEVESRSTLTRVREGGTPYNADQSLFPYAVMQPDDGGIAGDVRTGLIASPPEYTPCRGVLFQYGNSWNSVVTALVSSLTAGTVNDEIAYVVVANQTTATSAASAFSAAGANMSKVVFIIQPSNSIWLRDYGPHFIWQGGTQAIVDSHYYPTRPLDNFIPTLVGDGTFGISTYDMGLYYSGGNFQPGPGRTGFVTSLINLDNPSTGGHNDALIRELYGTFQGIDTLHILPQLPSTVDGTGHIDMWMYLVDSNTVVISEFIAGSNATAISITNNAVPYMQALGFEVIRPKAWNSSGVHYTYANAFRVNNRIFIPCYGTQLVAGGTAAYNDEDADALAKWQTAAGAGVQIVPIQCSSIISASGAIHCIVMQVPRYVDTMPAAHVVEPMGGEVWVAGESQLIRWNASDTDNVALTSVDLAYSTNAGAAWTAIASGIADSGSYNWTIPATESLDAVVRVTAHAANGATTVAMSNPFRLATGSTTVHNFATGAGVNKFGAGYQTGSWTNINGVNAPVSTTLTAANYTALSTSNATGVATDTNRYISTTVSSSSECTQLFRFSITDPIADIDEIRVRLEGFAANCTQVELYVWNNSLLNWGDAGGLVGQNRFLDSWAGNADESLRASLRNNIGSYLAADGTLRFLVYAERIADETYLDYMSVTVVRANDPAPLCPSDIDGNGAVDGSDLAALLSAWGACQGCATDLDGNGFVDGSDLGALLGAWGPCL